MEERCEESKCVSKGRSDLSNSAYTCYGDDGTFFPKLCADGYIPWTLEEEEFTAPWDPYHYLGSGAVPDYSRNISVSYFTCCPPVNSMEEDRSSEASTFSKAARHCSDSIVFDASQDVPVTICEGQGNNRTFPHRRKTALNGWWMPIDSVICCDYEDTNATDFLDETECVPYRDGFYKASKIYPNQLYVEFPLTCDVPGFSVPRPLEEGQTFDDVLADGAYRCCQNGTALPSVVKDTTYWVNRIPVPLVLCLGLLVSLWVVLGLSIPLLMQLKEGTYQGATAVASSRRRGRGPTYSSYNLYLVYLALSDAVMTILMLPFYLGHFTKFHLAKLLGISGTFNCVTNLWLNAIMMHRVLQLLQASKSATRIQQPTLKRVSLEALLIYLLAIANGITYFYGTITPHVWGRTFMITSNVLLIFLPLGYGVFVAILVGAKGYLRSPSREAATTARDRAMRDLAIYFLRIVATFAIVWTPVLVMTFIYIFDRNQIAVVGYMNHILMGIQPIATTCAILTKADCRKYLFDLITFSYCRCRLDKHPKTSLIEAPKKHKSNLDKDDLEQNLEPSSNSKIGHADVELGGTARTEQLSERKPFGEDDDNPSESLAETMETKPVVTDYASKRAKARQTVVLPSGELVSG